MQLRKISPPEVFLASLSFLLPLLLFYITSSDCLMFDDAGEFALVIKLGSIAHPPGTPAYILTAMAWLKIAGILGCSTIGAITLYSSFCVSLGSLILFFTFRKILLHIDGEGYHPLKSALISLFCALTFALGATAWSYANTIEVYSFQELAMCVALGGLVHFHFNRTFWPLLFAGFGIGLGLGNHHLTMILFLPFVPLFFLRNLFSIPLNKNQKKKSTGPSFVQQLKEVLWSKSFWLLAGMSAGFTLLFYGLMFLRAQREYVYMFALPDTLDKLLYHVRGGSYVKNLSGSSLHLMGERIPYFMRLTFFHFLFFLPFLLYGCWVLLRSRRKVLFSIVVLFYLFLLTYQLFNNQWANTDAYMLLPFLILVIPVFFGIRKLFDSWKLNYILPVLILVQIAYNFPRNDRRNYPVSRDLMHMLDVSAPKNSIVMLSDWSTLIQYYYYRITENFRPDLTVLSYDVKFTHYRILPLMYPAFYQKIKPEYDHLIDEMRKVHPEEVTSTGCNLTTDVLMQSFRSIIEKLEALAAAEHIPFMTDPKAHIFYVQQHFYSENRFVSGGLVSTMPGDSASAANFLPMNFSFLKSKLLLEDAGALDKMEELHAMLDYHVKFYTVSGDSVRLEQANSARDKILGLQREMRRSMSFAYKLK